MAHVVGVTLTLDLLSLTSSSLSQRGDLISLKRITQSVLEILLAQRDGQPENIIAQALAVAGAGAGEPPPSCHTLIIPLA